MNDCDLAVRNIGELWSLQGAGAVRGDGWAEPTPLRDVTVLVQGSQVASIGPTEELSDVAAAREIDAAGGTVVPGLVDAHTHPVFAGDRVWELDAKLQGTTYEELLSAGGGIHATVDATRAATGAELVASAARRIASVAAAGTTTLEAKSGYDLTPRGELALLEVLGAVAQQAPARLVRTLLAAHAVPPDREDDRGAFVDEISGVAKEAADRGLADFVDAFVDRGALTIEEGRQVLQAGRDAGLGVRVHADELTRTGATQLAVELGAASVDHCNHVRPDDIELLAGSDTTAVLCPATPFSSLGSIPYAPARELIDAGCSVALGSDLNPNAYNESMVFTMRLATFMMGMRPIEALVAATRNAAHSLGLADAGRLFAGGPADLVVLDAPGLEDVFYRFGRDPVRAVVAAGAVVNGSPS